MKKGSISVGLSKPISVFTEVSCIYMVPMLYIEYYVYIEFRPPASIFQDLYAIKHSYISLKFPFTRLVPTR